jgi:Flp pilus assembly protein TadG
MTSMISRHRPSRRWPPSRVRRRGHASRGQALVEIALVLPVLLLVLAAAGDLARVFGTRVAIESAARAGALEAALHPTSFQAGQPCDANVNRVMCAVLTETGGSVGVTAADVSVACSPSPCVEALGNQVQVTVVAHVQLLTPILAPFTGGQAFDTSATAVAQLAVRPNILGASPSPVATPPPPPAPTPPPDPSPTPFCIPPTADFSISPTSGKKKWIDFQFTDLSTTTALCPLTWSWNFGDGAGAASTSTAQNPTHTYDAQGVYTVTLVVSNYGGSATKSRSVTVTP